ncbi:MAG: DUF2306 domain-containing protein [Nitratireductor sp.]
MNFQLLFEQNLAVQLHILFAVVSFFVGALVLWRRKGGSAHKKWGKFWVFAMVGTALTSFFINEIRLVGPFSPIHLISAFTLYSLYLAVMQARNRQIKLHERSMKATYIGGMVIAGGLAFMPGRLMTKITIEPTLLSIFGENTQIYNEISPTLNWVIPIVGALIAFLLVFRKQIMARDFVN